MATDDARSGQQVFYFHVEVRPFIGAAYIFVGSRTPGAVLDNASVRVDKSKVTLVVKGGGGRRATKKRCVNLKDIRLAVDQDSCSGLRQSSQGVFARIQLEDSDALTVPPPRTPEPRGPVLEANVPYDVRCSFCDSKFFNSETQFKQVLELPVDDLLAESLNFFCHVHEGEERVDSNPSFLPRTEDCFVGNKCFVVDSRVVDLCRVDVKSSSVKCKRCGCAIGEIVCPSHEGASLVMPAFKFYTYAVAVEPCSGNIRDSCDKRVEVLEKAFLSLVVKVGEKPNRRIVVLNMDKNEKPLLIWMLDSCIYQGEADLVNEETDVHVKHVHKVLYAIEDVDTERVKSWLKSVPVVSYPEDLYVAGINLLLQNTKRLPAALRSIDSGMWVAYFPGL